jgi:hypothetical protein
MLVKKIKMLSPEIENVPALLDKENIPFQVIDNVNWEKSYPYRPIVHFRIAHTNDAILLNYRVAEKSIRAKYDKDNGSVWTDSCVEFFSIPADDGMYYNIECNCIGTILIGAGHHRDDRERAPQSVLNLVKRWSSLGNCAFEERKGDISWEVVLYIPYKAYFKHHITSLDGKTVKANFYKCGDELETPHFLSWSPINIEKPDFHRPDFFGQLEFE